ncbi:MAG: right-handed parallel beta-helix repeat-containing protein [Candidatus Lokiarchaeota archaeon]|nr:right-handed parallel beta-helix repeat-containing protein [Candidatus Lokiarchaeota archaeon]
MPNKKFSHKFLTENSTKLSYYNNSASPIFIDDTNPSRDWAWAVLQPWCNGSGTESDPYVIENLKINGNNASSCIEIINSNAHFIVRNCTLYNSSSGSYPYYNGGIKLISVSNGQILNNTCVNNTGQGVALGLSNDNEISNNICINNTMSGIYFCDDSDFNYISGNEICSNSLYGIFLDYECDDNIIEYNNISNLVDQTPQQIGIYIRYQCIRNYIIYNDVHSMYFTGILLNYDCNNNTIAVNDACDNHIEGIRLERNCNYNSIFYNNVSNKFSLLQDYGIYVEGCSDNTITDNLIYFNALVGLILNNSDRNVISNNFFYKNTKNAEDNKTSTYWDYMNIGNYWNDYSGSFNTNGIGMSPYYISNSSDFMVNQDNYPLMDSVPEVDYAFNVSEDRLVIDQWYMLNYNGSGGNSPLTYEWFYNDTYLADTPSFEFQFKISGYFDITLIVTDINHNSSILTKQVLVRNTQINDIPETPETPDSRSDQDIPLKIVIITLIIIGIVLFLSIGIFVIKRKKTSLLKSPDFPVLLHKQGLKTPKSSIKALPISNQPVVKIKGEIDNIESEVGVEKQKFICIVHKGPIIGPSYICPNCDALYCLNCANALKEKSEKCWTCGSNLI